MDIQATKDIEKQVEDLKAINSRLALLDRQKKETVEALKEYMGDADTLLNAVGDAVIGTLSWQGGKPKFDAKTFEESHPKLYKNFLVDTEPYQVFRTK